jgi:hypothetical protein
MPIHNGRTKQIAACVAKHPGSTRREILDALGMALDSGMVTYCVSAGIIFSAGPVRSQRYYPTAEQAAAVDAMLRAQARALSEQRRADDSRNANLRRRARRLSAGGKMVNSRPRDGVKLDPGVTVSTDARLTIQHHGLRDFWQGQCVARVIDAPQARPWAMLAFGGTHKDAAP